MYDVTNEERAPSWSSDEAPLANGLANGDGGERGRGWEEDIRVVARSRLCARSISRAEKSTAPETEAVRAHRFQERHRIAVRSICLNKSSGELQSRQAGRELAAGFSHSKERDTLWNFSATRYCSLPR